jgi:lipopolysaccharide transport system ATP-binding protein
MRPAIRVDGLSKRYALEVGKARAAQYRTLRESVTNGIARLTQRIRTGAPKSDHGDLSPGTRSEFWAIKDVSFNVQPGEVVGVIGRNGAGKSTLLKLISRIVAPTEGCIRLSGRVGSLLEVGTGFHPELTGRENVYLNGAILGMSRREIARKFDEIVAFAEVDRFLDMPVKRYSSGMYMKLAFAVASHLEPEILLVDEVLAVGDAQFQKKCLGKMGDVSRQGRTVLFVSHNMTAIKSLCTRAIHISGGTIDTDGDVNKVVHRYLDGGTRMGETGIIPEDAPRYRCVQGEAAFRSVRLTDSSGVETTQLYYGQPFHVHFVCDVMREIQDGHWEISISTPDGIQVTYATTMQQDGGSRVIHPGRHEVSAAFDVKLLPRDYTIDLGVHHQTGRTADFVQGTRSFTVLRVSEGGTDHYPWPRTRGYVDLPARWVSRQASVVQ